MRYRVFDNQAAATAYTDAQTALLPVLAGDATRIWDVPRRLADGRWIVASSDCDDDDGGEAWQEAFTAPAEA